MWLLSVLQTVLVAALVTKASALSAPAYLSVPQFKDCLGHKMVNGGASYWCKLSEKPEKCPLESWKQLHEAGEENAFKGSNCVD